MPVCFDLQALWAICGTALDGVSWLNYARRTSAQHSNQVPLAIGRIYKQESCVTWINYCSQQNMYPAYTLSAHESSSGGLKNEFYNAALRVEVEITAFFT